MSRVEAGENARRREGVEQMKGELIRDGMSSDRAAEISRSTALRHEREGLPTAPSTSEGPTPEIRRHIRIPIVSVKE